MRRIQQAVASKWADYLIFAARYDAAESRISRVRVHADHGDSLGPGMELLRHQVISLLASGTTFATMLRGHGEQGWKRGAFVTPVVLDGVTYLRTDQDDAAGDDLDGLPTF
ncbi:MAG: DUF3892 domain-containing protein [Mycobacteriales bacterium]